MRVIGTAGHVDHGKSALVTALTGIDPDRLHEEKQRGLTIQLGYAWMAQHEDGTGERIGLIDVPGHLDFIRNMLAGVTGIDAALLVVAADEGVMPQTREHLAILDLLRIPVCLPVLTKVDTIEDSEWLALVEMDFAELLAESRYREAEIIKASAHTGYGMEELAHQIRSLDSHKPQAILEAPARLPIDRIFTQRGFGTIVTGTLVAGRLAVGEDIHILPSGEQGRIRGLQAYHQSVETCEAGMRVAVNVSGISHGDIQRGHTLCHPGTWQSSLLLDVELQQLPQVGITLQHDMEVMVFHGASEVLARVRTIGDSEIEPGSKGYCQLVLAEPAVVGRSDRFIVRMPSPSLTLGGGTVLEAPSGKFWKRFTDNALDHFQALSSAEPGVRLVHQVERSPFLRELTVNEDPEYQEGQLSAVIGHAIDQRKLLRLTIHREPHLITGQQAQQWEDFVLHELRQYHQTHPLRRGQQRGELYASLAARMQRQWGHKLTPGQFTGLLSLWQEKCLLRIEANNIALPAHVVSLTAQQQEAARQLAASMDSKPFNPPPMHEIQRILNQDAPLLESLIESGEYVLLGTDILFQRSALSQMQTIVLAMLDEQETVTMAQVRDRLQASRKYVQALLEHMDAEQLTRRQGDARIRC